MRQKVSMVRSSAVSRIAYDADDPAVDLALVPAEQRLEGFEVAVTELPQHVGWLFQHWHLLPFYIHLRRRGGEGYRDLSVLPPPRK